MRVISRLWILIVLPVFMIAALCPGVAAAVSADGPGESGSDSLAVQSTPPSAAASRFSDVSATDWVVAEGWLDYAVSKGYVSGYAGSTKFGPGDPLSRGMAATIIYRVATNKTADTTDNNVMTRFADAPKGKWYSAAVAWCAERGVVTGYSGTAKFGPDDPVTREQLAAMIARYCQKVAGQKSAGSDVSKFKDAGRISSWAKEGIAFCSKNGIVSGVGSSGNFDPQGNATRSHMAKMITVVARDVPGAAGAAANGAGSAAPVSEADMKAAYNLYSDVIDEWNRRMAFEQKYGYNGDTSVSKWPYTSGNWLGTGIVSKRSNLVYTLVSLDDRKVPFLLVADPSKDYRLWGLYGYDESYNGGSLAFETYSLRYTVHLCTGKLMRFYYYAPAVNAPHISESVGHFSQFKMYNNCRITDYDKLARTEGGVDSSYCVWYDVNGNVVERGAGHKEMRARFEAAYPADGSVIWKPVSGGFDPSPFSSQLSSWAQ